MWAGLLRLPPLRWPLTAPPPVSSLQTDPVPNVRFNAAKVLERLAPLVDAPLVDAQLRPCLAALADDGDTDVRFFAARALAAFEEAAAMN